MPAGLEQLLCSGILSGVPVNLRSLGPCIFFVVVAAAAATWLLLLLLVIIIPLLSATPGTVDRLVLLLALPPQKDASLWFPGKSKQIIVAN